MPLALGLQRCGQDVFDQSTEEFDTDEPDPETTAKSRKSKL